LKRELEDWQKLLKNMAKSKSIVDAKGKEIQVGDRMRFATWGMLDLWIKNTEKSGRQAARRSETRYLYRAWNRGRTAQGRGN
jgi:hypothetical protein